MPLKPVDGAAKTDCSAFVAQWNYSSENRQRPPQPGLIDEHGAPSHTPKAHHRVLWHPAFQCLPTFLLFSRRRNATKPTMWKSTTISSALTTTGFDAQTRICRWLWTLDRDMFSLDKYHPSIRFFKVPLRWIAHISSMKLVSTNQIIGSFGSCSNRMAIYWLHGRRGAWSEPVEVALLPAEMVNKQMKRLHITPISEKPSSPDVKKANWSLNEMNHTIGRNLLVNARFPPENCSLELEWLACKRGSKVTNSVWASHSNGLHCSCASLVGRRFQGMKCFVYEILLEAFHFSTGQYKAQLITFCSGRASYCDDTKPRNRQSKFLRLGRPPLLKAQR
jgi:hypothetical protein